MLDFIKALTLGLVEGLTEFIPVSSTAHLVVLSDLVKFEGPPGHIFEIFIQLGAILAVVVLYRQKIWQTFIGLPRGETAQKFTLNIIVATLPALFIGALIHDWLKSHAYTPNVIAAALFIGGIIILLCDKKFNNPRIDNIDAIPLKTALLIGVCQAMALIPGISRSGATIIGATALGLSRPVAAEFSFFLSIPIMCAAVAFDLLKGWRGIVEFGHPEIMIGGFITAFISALFVMKWMIVFLNRHGFTPFGWYRLAAAIVLFAFFL